MTITTEILDVAAVVVGEDRARLTGWQLDDAIAAMTALGYSTKHIAYCLLYEESTVRKRANQLNVKLHRHDQRPDWFAIDMVSTGTAQMHLIGIDRIEAIRVMAAKKLDSIEIGRRLMCEPSNVCTLAAKNGIRITTGRDATWERIRRPNSWRRLAAHQAEAVAA